MDGGYYGSAGKRSYYDNDGSERNGRQKRRAISDSDQTQSAPSSGDTEYRILCPGNKIGGIIGKGGGVIKAIRQETRAKVKVEDAIPGSEERVIYISSSSKGGRDNKSKDTEDGKEELLCPAQEALFRVHAKITDTAVASDEDDDDLPSSVTARLLVPNNQVGCLIGKGGKIIEQMRKEIGGQIRVLPRDQLPACALPTDEIVQLSGEPALVKKALYAISSKLFENPPRERTQRPSIPQGSTIPSADSYLSSGNLLSHGGSFIPPAGGPIMGLRHSIPSLGGLGGGEVGNTWSFGSSLPVLSSVGTDVPHVGGSEEFSIKVLCPNEKIGSMIGKGGNNIRKLREDTGAKIKIGDPISNSDERIIQISSTEYMDGTTSPAIDAALQVQIRLAEVATEKDTDSTTVTTRLLVPSNQIGSLIGKGGQIIADMRKSTKANIKIPSKDELPPAAGESDELVLISGEQYAAQAALVQVLQRLRNNLFKGHDTGGRSESGVFPPLGLQNSAAALPTYGGMYEPGSPGRMYSLAGGIGYQGLGYSANYASYGSPGSVAVQAPGKTQRDSRRKQR
eukprot:c26796_g2_i1 orf=228-1925(+)